MIFRPTNAVNIFHLVQWTRYSARVAQTRSDGPPSSVLCEVCSARYLPGSRTASSGMLVSDFHKPVLSFDDPLELEKYLTPKAFTSNNVDQGHTGCIPFLYRKETLKHGIVQHGEERKNESPSSSAPPHFQECRAQLPLDFPRAAAIAGPHGSSAVAGNDSEPEMISAASSPAQVAERKS